MLSSCFRKHLLSISRSSLSPSIQRGLISTAAPQIALLKEGLKIQFGPGPGSPSEVFPYVWLKDADEQLIHPSTRQKLHSTADIPSDIRAIDARLTQNDSHVLLTWSHDDTPRPSSSNHTLPWSNQTEIPVELLRRYADPGSDKGLAKYHHSIKPTPWKRADLLQSQSSSNDLRIPYTSLQTPTGLLRALEQLTRYGILFLENVPHEDVSNTTCELHTLGSYLGEIRETFYGRVWDVRSLGHESKNVAYTNQDLGLHMDLLYYESPPRYQILHMVRRRGVDGGESVFSDALDAATDLRMKDPEAFRVLCESPVGFHYMNDGHHLYREHPTIELVPSHFNSFSSSSLVASKNGEDDPQQDIAYINYSPPFQTPLPLRTARAPGFLPAFREFTRAVHAPERLYEYMMEEGDAVIFDNRRVLHARREFKNSEAGSFEDSNDIRRWLKGCYVEADSVMDRLRVLRANTT